MALRSVPVSVPRFILAPTALAAALLVATQPALAQAADTAPQTVTVSGRNAGPVSIAGVGDVPLAKAPFSATVHHVAGMDTGLGAALRTQLRTLLNYHCGVTTLRTRQMIRDLQGL